MMIRFVRLIVAALHVAVLLSACSAFAAYPYDSVCQVGSSHRWGFRSYGGSGVLIGVRGDEALVLCVQHVAIRPGRVCTCRWGGVEAHGYVAAANRGGDVALLIVSRPAGVRPVPVAMPTPDSGPFVLCGYPGYDRNTLRFQTGNFVALTDSRLIVDCQPEKGMSGGPCFDRYGRVVGTVSAYNPRQQIGLCGSGVVMLDLVDNYLRIQ